LHGPRATIYKADMPQFPSMEWCRSIEATLAQDPAAPAALKEWGGKTVGFIITRGDGLAKDFCLFIKPHPTALKAEELRECEDEDDLELEEPDYLFKVPFSICKQLMKKQLDPLAVLRQGEVKVVGDVKVLIVYGQKFQAIGERAMEKVETVF
jgi:putative sterol carrier protein